MPVFLDATAGNRHLAILAMTGSGKIYALGRVIERLVSQYNGIVVVFDPHGEYGRAFAGGNLQFNEGADRSPRPSSPAEHDPSAFSGCRGRGVASSLHAPAPAFARSTRGELASLFSSTTSTWTTSAIFCLD